MTPGKPPTRAQLESNLRRFINFRLFFNARFYYPVFTILYLDYGLTLEQFAILNLVWALTIVLAEVPSGAMADIFGRKKLLVFASILMFVEMGLLVVVPIGTSSLLFIVFILNRICSGLAEAAASGADEALAYDSLVALGREKDWPHLLEKTTRALSIGFFIAMITGAFSYDPKVMNTVVGWINPNWTMPPHLIMRMPIILTLCTSCIVVATTLGMREITPAAGTTPREQSGSLIQSLVRPFEQVFKAASWTLGHRFILFVILAALALDSVARQFVVLGSEYYRIIHIPPAWFGFIGAGLALLGFVTAKLSRHLVTQHTPFFNFLALSAFLLVGLIGVAFALPWVGVLFAIPVFMMMGLVKFQSSFYINREVDSAHRATVLSFNGLALNLGLGIASLFYTGLITTLKAGADPSLSGEALKETVFVHSLASFPLYFIALFLLLIACGRRFLKKS